MEAPTAMFEMGFCYNGVSCDLGCFPVLESLLIMSSGGLSQIMPSESLHGIAIVTFLSFCPVVLVAISDHAGRVERLRDFSPRRYSSQTH